MDKISFVFYLEFKKYFKALSYEDAGKLIMGIFDYVENGVIPDLNEVGNMAFLAIQTWLDIDKTKWEDKCKARKIAGKKGSDKRWNSKNSKAINLIAKIADNENENENEKDNDNENGNENGNDIDAIASMYNEICVSFPRLQKLSTIRLTAIKARLKSGYTREDFKTVFTKAENSKFLKGGNDRNWSANFDWLIKDSNIAKILEGNYDDKEGNGYGKQRTAEEERNDWGDLGCINL